MAEAKSNKAKVPNDVLHVLILVAGTTDPTNTSPNDQNRAQSYGQLPKRYWDDGFIEGMTKFDDEYINLVLFPFHGWSGDNGIENREEAGAYLVNRLCGANEIKPYYEKTYQNKPMYFHLLGHSHGGNVINEMTKHIDKLGDTWPKKWKIKSLTYLSTPFFKELHQVKVSETFFHEDAEVLSLYNDFDLTQRMLADFSLETLSDELIKLDTEELNKNINIFKNTLDSYPVEYLKEYEWQEGYAYMSYEHGQELYTTTIKLLEDLREVFSQNLQLIEPLAQVKTFEAEHKDFSKVLQKKQHSIIPQAEFIKMKDFIEVLELDLDGVMEDLRDKIKEHINDSSKFSKMEYLEILILNNQFIPHLIEFFDINPATLKNDGKALWSILYKILLHNIEKYDNTYVKPNQQFETSFLKEKIKNVDVTHDDPYSNTEQVENYEKFINYIEGIEKNYETNPSQYNLLDLLLTLVGNEATAYSIIERLPNIISIINTAEYIATGRLDARLKLFRTMLTNLKSVFDTRYFGGLVDTSHKLSAEDKQKGVVQRGSLLYFLKESHSTSRRVLHREVKEFIEKLGAKR